MRLIYILFLNCIIFLSHNSLAEDISVIDLIEKQLKIIEAQDKKIKNLENLVNELSKKVNNINSSVSVENEKNENEVTVEENSNESEIGSSSSQKVYNPEKAFFGPLQPLKSVDGNYTAGLMGLVQLDAAMAEGKGWGGFDITWNAVWEGKTSLHSEGWSAEIRIPFNVFQFSKGNIQTWGASFQRGYFDKQEELKIDLK